MAQRTPRTSASGTRLRLRRRRRSPTPTATTLMPGDQRRAGRSGPRCYRQYPGPVARKVVVRSRSERSLVAVPVELLASRVTSLNSIAIDSITAAATAGARPNWLRKRTPQPDASQVAQSSPCGNPPGGARRATWMLFPPSLRPSYSTVRSNPDQLTVCSPGPYAALHPQQVLSRVHPGQCSTEHIGLQRPLRVSGGRATRCCRQCGRVGSVSDRDRLTAPGAGERAAAPSAALGLRGQG